MKPAEAMRAAQRRKERGNETRITRAGYELVCKAIRRGILPKPASLLCVDCGQQAQTYDHRFYSRPLEVEPVCRSCNKHRGSAWDLEILSEKSNTHTPAFPGGFSSSLSSGFERVVRPGRFPCRSGAFYS